MTARLLAAVIRLAVEQPVAIDLPEGEQIERYYRYGYVADCNVQAARLFGLDRAEQLIGARLEAIAPRGDPEQMQRTLVAIRALGQITAELFS